MVEAQQRLGGGAAEARRRCGGAAARGAHGAGGGQKGGGAPPLLATSMQCPCNAHMQCAGSVHAVPMYEAHQHALQRALTHGEGAHGLGVSAAASEARPLLGVP